MSELLGGRWHYPVCYGYQSMGNDFGYIVHYGWGDSVKEKRSWINSAWCNSYISLKMNHEHDYTDTKKIVNGDKEYKCSTCGHRSIGILEPGSVYDFKNVGSGLYMDVFFAAVAWHSPVVQDPYNGGGDNQRFQAHYNSDDGTYSFQPMHTEDKILENYNGQLIIHQNDNRHAGKRFFVLRYNGKHIIIPKNALGSVMATTDNARGRQISQQVFNPNNLNHFWEISLANEAPQQYRIEDGKVYNIMSLQSGYNLDVDWGLAIPGTMVLQHTCHGGENQKFRAEYLPNENVFVFRTLLDESMCLDISDGVLKIKPYTGSGYQKIIPDYVKSGRYLLRVGDQVLDVYGVNGAAYNVGTYIINHDFLGSDNQYWLLKEV